MSDRLAHRLPVVLVDVSSARAQAEANDIAHAVPFTHPPASGPCWGLLWDRQRGARIVDVLLHDQRAILTVCTRISGVPDCEGVTLSLPQLVGGDGELPTLPPPLDDTERLHHHVSSWTPAANPLLAVP